MALSDSLYEAHVVLEEALKEYTQPPYQYGEETIEAVKDIQRRIAAIVSRLDKPDRDDYEVKNETHQ